MIYRTVNQPEIPSQPQPAVPSQPQLCTSCEGVLERHPLLARYAPRNWLAFGWMALHFLKISPLPDGARRTVILWLFFLQTYPHFNSGLDQIAGSVCRNHLSVCRHSAARAQMCATYHATRSGSWVFAAPCTWPFQPTANSVTRAHSYRTCVLPPRRERSRDFRQTSIPKLPSPRSFALRHG